MQKWVSYRDTAYLKISEEHKLMINIWQEPREIKSEDDISTQGFISKYDINKKSSITKCMTART